MPSARPGDPPPRRRDRHGRGARGPLAWPRVPSMATRAQRFDQLVLDAASSVERTLGRDLDGLEIAVEEVPPAEPAPWEVGVPLGRLFPAEPGHRARVVLYRRPLETRATSADELASMVHEVLAEQVASMLGLNPDDLL